MKCLIKLISLFPALLLIIINSCRKEEVILPELITYGINYLTPKSAFCSGMVTVKGSPPILQKGLCWDDESLPDTSDNQWTYYSVTPYFEEYTHLLSNLNPETTYYIRSFGISNAGISYGNVLSFTTPADLSGTTGTVTDIEGNVYKTISIGTQVWMAENLKTTKFNDGTDIRLVIDSVSWSIRGDPAYCWYDNDEAAYKNLFGALYKHYTGITGKLCPTGWHVPSDDEWIILESYLGGADVAGIKLKESGFEHWKLSKDSHIATNESGFTGLPSGSRTSDGTFNGKGTTNFFWCSTSGCSLPGGRYRTQAYNGDFNFAGCFSMKGGSVRCVQD